MRGASFGVMSLLVVLGGCATAPIYPGQPPYSAAAYEQPQPVDFFYGTLIDARPVPLNLRPGSSASVGIGPAPVLPLTIGVNGTQGPGMSAGGLTVGPVNVYAEAAVPDVPAVEYTVLLDRKTYPPDPYLSPAQHPAIIVVQNRYPTDLPLAVNNRVFVRVVGNVAHVMRADTISPAYERVVSAGPLPVSLPQSIDDTVGEITRDAASPPITHYWVPPVSAYVQ